MYTYISAYIYIYIYIYIHARRVSIRFVLYACHSNHAGSSPHGGFFTFLFQFSSKIKNSNRSASHVPQEKHVAKMTVISLAQKKRSPFFQLAHWGERSWSSCRSIPHFEIQPKNLAHCQPANWPFHRAQVQKEFIL